MARRPGSGGVFSLSEVSVRPVVVGAERAEWDRLMDAHHYTSIWNGTNQKSQSRNGLGASSKSVVSVVMVSPLGIA